MTAASATVVALLVLMAVVLGVMHWHNRRKCAELDAALRRALTTDAEALEQAADELASIGLPDLAREAALTAARARVMLEVTDGRPVR